MNTSARPAAAPTQQLLVAGAVAVLCAKAVEIEQGQARPALGVLGEEVEQRDAELDGEALGGEAHLHV